jgi:hypothetical protein
MEASELVPESKSTMSELAGEMTPADFDVAFQEVFGIRQGALTSKRSSRTARRPESMKEEHLNSCHVSSR